MGRGISVESQRLLNAYVGQEPMSNLPRNEKSNLPGFPCLTGSLTSHGVHNIIQLFQHRSLTACESLVNKLRIRFSGSLSHCCPDLVKIYWAKNHDLHKHMVMKLFCGRKRSSDYTKLTK